MKLMDANMQTTQIANFAFSGVRPDKLGSTEYTLVTLVIDKTGSVSGFERQLLSMKQAVVEACHRSPRADYLMLRSTEFNERVDEEHGFTELTRVDPAGYHASRCSGSTALFDATRNAVMATNAYARMLSDQDFSVNGLVVVVTDGDDNCSHHTPSEVAAEVRRGVSEEWLESLSVILVGVNASRYKKELQAFQMDADLSQYVDVGDATPTKLAQLAQFVSRSISAQSQSLGTGGASQPLVF
ncbi:MAG: VWA domain-containing protein [Rhodoferax sp.]|jgi:uncharacterized protein YegL|nr:VWA domain-containing protein [Rhodoferax sp.]